METFVVIFIAGFWFFGYNDKVCRGGLIFRFSGGL